MTSSAQVAGPRAVIEIVSNRAYFNPGAAARLDGCRPDSFMPYTLFDQGFIDRLFTRGFVVRA